MSGHWIAFQPGTAFRYGTSADVLGAIVEVVSGMPYADFLKDLSGKVLFIELGVGFNTPGIIKYPFWNMTIRNPESVYSCINYGEAFCPEAIEDRSICINGDISAVLADLRQGNRP